MLMYDLTFAGGDGTFGWLMMRLFEDLSHLYAVDLWGGHEEDEIAVDSFLSESGGT